MAIKKLNHRLIYEAVEAMPVGSRFTTQELHELLNKWHITRGNVSNTLKGCPMVKVVGWISANHAAIWERVKQ